ncbi:MAG: LptF/LptG family permease [Aureispira sp.]
MKTIDKYLLKRYLSSFFFIVLLSSMLSVVIDGAEKVNDFLEEGGPTLGQVLGYYMNFVPFINGLIFPLYNLIAVVFFTARLASNTEFVAMLGNGVNYYRILLPYLMGATIIAGIHYYGNHYVIPTSNASRTLFENTYIYKHNYVGNSGNFHAAASPYEEFYLQGFNRYDSSGSQFAWIRHDSSRLHRTYVLTANTARLLEPPNKWRLSGIRIRRHKKRVERIATDSIETTAHPATLLYETQLMPPQFTIDTTIGLYIDDLIKRDNDKDNMTTNTLIQYIEKQKAKGTGGMIVFEVERYRRSADPFSIYILTLIGFAVASRKRRGGMAWNLVIGVGLSAVYIFMTKFATTFSIKGGLSPLLGVWVPNIVFALITVWMLSRAQK